MRRFGLHLLLLLAIMVLPFASTALAQRAPHDNGLSQAVKSVEDRTGGQVLSAEKRRIDGELKYRIKVLTPSGRVRIIYIDA